MFMPAYDYLGARLPVVNVETNHLPARNQAAGLQPQPMRLTVSYADANYYRSRRVGR